MATPPSSQRLCFDWWGWLAGPRNTAWPRTFARGECLTRTTPSREEAGLPLAASSNSPALEPSAERIHHSLTERKRDKETEEGRARKGEKKNEQTRIADKQESFACNVAYWICILLANYKMAGSSLQNNGSSQICHVGTSRGRVHKPKSTIILLLENDRTKQTRQLLGWDQWRKPIKTK